MNAELKTAAEYQKCLDDGAAAYPACLADAVIVVDDNPACSCDYCDSPF